jgi:hypothetical protein
MPLSGGREHPTSSRQERWAHAAEARGDLPRGTARRWSRRAKRRKQRTGKRY